MDGCQKKGLRSCIGISEGCQQYHPRVSSAKILWAFVLTGIQIQEPTPLSYITHLWTKWVVLNKIHTKEITSNYKRGWDTDEHFTIFMCHLGRKQAAMLQDSITISDANKEHHLMVEVPARNLFDCPVMIEWNEKTQAQKTYTRVVTFFTKQLSVIENF